MRSLQVVLGHYAITGDADSADSPQVFGRGTTQGADLVIGKGGQLFSANHSLRGGVLRRATLVMPRDATSYAEAEALGVDRRRLVQMPGLCPLDRAAVSRAGQADQAALRSHRCSLRLLTLMRSLPSESPPAHEYVGAIVQAILDARIIHSAILSLTGGTPAFALRRPGHMKAECLFGSFGLPDHVIHFDRPPERWADAIIATVERGQAARAEIRTIVTRLAAESRDVPQKWLRGLAVEKAWEGSSH